jgi:fructose transport system ATP-binding protein
MSSTDAVFKARGVVKRFGHVTALSGADFDLYAGEVLAVIGDNGAGKSTLIKVLSGALQPDEGEIYLDGGQVHFRTPLEARRAGIETVYQDLAVAPALDIASNLFLGRELRRRGPLGQVFRMLDKRAMRREAGTPCPSCRSASRRCALPSRISRAASARASRSRARQRGGAAS